MTENELYHYGIKGMKWGVRRYQNADGSLTAADKKRNNKESKKERVKAGVRAAIDVYTRDKTKGQIAVDAVMASIGTAALVGGAIMKGKEMISAYNNGRDVAYQVLSKTGDVLYTKYK